MNWNVCLHWELLELEVNSPQPLLLYVSHFSCHPVFGVTVSKYYICIREQGYFIKLLINTSGSDTLCRKWIWVDEALCPVLWAGLAVTATKAQGRSSKSPLGPPGCEWCQLRLRAEGHSHSMVRWPPEVNMDRSTRTLRFSIVQSIST